MSGFYITEYSAEDFDVQEFYSRGKDEVRLEITANVILEEHN